MLVCKKSGKKLVAFVTQDQNNDKGHLVFIHLRVVLAKGRQRGMPVWPKWQSARLYVSRWELSSPARAKAAQAD